METRHGAVDTLSVPLAPSCATLLTRRLALVDVRWRLHAVVAQDLEQLVPEGRNVLFDFIEVILCHALGLGAALLLHDVPFHQVTHHLLQM